MKARSYRFTDDGAHLPPPAAAVPAPLAGPSPAFPTRFLEAPCLPPLLPKTPGLDVSTPAASSLAFRLFRRWAPLRRGFAINFSVSSDLAGFVDGLPQSASMLLSAIAVDTKSDTTFKVLMSLRDCNWNCKHVLSSVTFINTYPFAGRVVTTIRTCRSNQYSAELKPK